MIFESLKFLSTIFHHIKDGISVIFWCYGAGEKQKPLPGNAGENTIAWLDKLRNANGKHGFPSASVCQRISFVTVILFFLYIFLDFIHLQQHPYNDISWISFISSSHHEVCKVGGYAEDCWCEVGEALNGSSGWKYEEETNKGIGPGT